MNGGRFALVLAAGLAAGLAATAPASRAQPPQAAKSAALAQSRTLVAIDGDSFAVVTGARRELVRMLGLDAPELRGSRCAAERDLALKARDALAALLRTPPLRIHRDRTRRDKYGRTLARVTAGGRDVATVLIAAGLARPYAGGRRQPWCPGAPARAAVWRGGR